MVDFVTSSREGTSVIILAAGVQSANEWKCGRLRAAILRMAEVRGFAFVYALRNAPNITIAPLYMFHRI